MCNQLCPPNSTQHVITMGDTFWRLSQTYGISLQSIIDANAGVDPQNLQIGSTVCIPAVPTPIAPQMQPAACPEGTFSYTIKAGDTFWRLSQTYGISLQSIIDANAGVDPQNLQIGSTVCIPAVPTPIAPQKPPVLPVLPMPEIPQIPSVPHMPLTPPAVPTPLTPLSYFAYLIRKYDTICRIARKFYVSEDSILQINPGIDPRCLVAGTIIHVPINCCGPNAFRYVVRSGDTLNRIANRFNVCPLDLIAANPNIDFKCLVKCQIICIPSA